MTSTLAFFVLICVLVFVHEYGHFWAARRCGVKVERFSIGFGKVLFRKTDKQGTEFAFSLIPLGGYVRMYNGDPDQVGQPYEALYQKTVLQRAFIVFAGPLANFLFALFAYWVVFIVGVPSVKPVIGSVLPNTIAAEANLVPELEIKRVAGREVLDWEEAGLALVSHIGSSIEVEGHMVNESMPRYFQLDLRQWHFDGTKENLLHSLGLRAKSGTVEPIIERVVEYSAADKMGVRSGDEILQINEKPFDWHYLIQEVQQGKPLHLTIKRLDTVQTMEIMPEKSSENGRYVIGIQPRYQSLAEQYRTELKYDILTAFEKAWQKVWTLIQTILQFIGNLLTGNLNVNNLGGPISLAKGAGASVEIGWVYYLSFMALISVNLGVMNLFPLLPLDGGQLLFLGAEAVKGKPISDNIQLKFQQIGFILVGGLMFFALFNDVLHF